MSKISRFRPRMRRGMTGKRFVIIASQFNPSVTRALVRGATDVLRRQGVPPRAIRLLWVPGAFELPVLAARIATTRPRPHAIIALGALIRGDTPQYDVLAHAVAQGLSRVAVNERILVTFGVIVAATAAQARARAGLPAPRGSYRRKARQAGGAMGNRGAEAARAAVEMLSLFERAGISYPN